MNIEKRYKEKTLQIKRFAGFTAFLGFLINFEKSLFLAFRGERGTANHI